MRNVGLIMFIAYVVWQIVYSVSQAAQKKDQQRRARELAEQRRRAADGAPPASTPGQLSTAAGPGGAARGTSRLDELAERRRQQLEQLRLRRARQGGAAPQVRVGAPSVPTPPTPPTAAVPAAVPAVPVPSVKPRSRSALAADHESLRQYRESAEKELHAKRRQLAKQAKSEQRKAQVREKESERQFQEERASKRAARQKAPSASSRVAATFTPGGPVNLDAIRARVRDRQVLRELFVLKELLDPPLSMRTAPGAGSLTPGDPV